MRKEVEVLVGPPKRLLSTKENKEGREIMGATRASKASMKPRSAGVERDARKMVWGYPPPLGKSCRGFLDNGSEGDAPRLKLACLASSRKVGYLMIRGCGTLLSYLE